MSKPTTIAFYLPQFHPIPENDGWYGAGFTEWRNVVRATPLFPGHHQPRLPADLGFYDLRVPEVHAAQAAMAKAHGIDAFCYYHYWFEGHRPLRRVVDEILARRTADIPFCLAWANENWARHWDASDHEVLLRQRYSPTDDDAHAEFLLTALSHPGYLRVDGKPILFVYRPQAMPDAARTMERWREIWRAAGLPEVEIIKFDTHGDQQSPALYGADAAAQFVPHGVAETADRIHPPGCHHDNGVWDYEEVMRAHLAMEQPAWRRHECVAPNWDNTPRRGDGRSVLLHGSTPALYEEWLRGIHDRAPADGLVLINAWNEWAEGAHLEPDLEHGHAYLEATARALGVPVPVAAPVVPGQLAPPESAVVHDHFAGLYLDTLASETVLRRKLSRLEAMFERQLDLQAVELMAAVNAARSDAEALTAENARLRQELAGAVAAGRIPTPTTGS